MKDLTPALVQEVCEFYADRPEYSAEFMTLLDSFLNMEPNQTMIRAGSLKPEHIGKWIQVIGGKTPHAGGNLNDFVTAEVRREDDFRYAFPLVIDQKLIFVERNDVILITDDAATPDD